MKKFFLIPLMALCTCVMAWAGNQPIAPVPFQSNEYAPAQKAAAPIRMAKADAVEQDVLLEYEGFSQHFTSLQAAFNALPENSTPATVTLYSDVDVDYEGRCLSVAAYQRVTLELNGHGIYGTTDAAISTVVIENRGNLTINDAVGTGIITNLAANPDVDWSAEDEAHPYPRYANNVINNRGNGVLTINGGLIKNETGGAAAYPIDMYDNSTLIINGGHIYNYFTDAIRCFASGNNDVKTVTMNNGLVEGYYAIWMQEANGNTPKINLTINGGEIRSTAKCYAVENTCTLQEAGTVIYNAGYGEYSGEDITVTITNGTFNENIFFDRGVKLHISGGTFNGYVMPALQSLSSIDGGIFDFNGNVTIYLGNTPWTELGYASRAEGEADGWIFTVWGGEWGSAAENSSKFLKGILSLYLKSGYVWKYIGSTPENEDDDLVYQVVPAHSEEVTESKTMEQIAQEIVAADPTQQVEATIIEIDATAQLNDAIVTVTDDIAVEGIVIKATNDQSDATKEGQIVVESGVTLTVGNSGIVSENNDLTTVVVKPGGTVIVGNGGVDQQGQATPVEIRSSSTESGVFLIDPNASAAVAEAPAKVKVYTRAYREGGIDHWQQLASPVKGDRNNENKIIVKPVGELASNPNFYTSMYSWDYATDSWVRITTGEGMVDLGNDVYAFNAQWTTTDAVLKPFAAFDLINNSLESHGGVTYEFAGELVGNGDMELSFPENGFCTFGNSYTAPIDLESFFVTVKNDIQYAYDANDNLIATSAIDPCVYIFNSSKNCFESVNQAAIKLWKKGIKTPAFTQIPPQQAFVMNLLKGNSGQSAVSYATSVWGNPQGQNVAIKAPKRAEEASTLSALLEITVTDGNATDRVMLIEDEEYSNEYDFGADAVKYMNGSFNLYANTTLGQLDMVATDNIENTELSFKAGNAVNYTISFNNVEGDFVLVDNANNNQIAIVEGGIYTFAAQPNYTAENRFAIVPAAKMPTAIENTEVKANAKGIYTVTGQYLGENFDILPAGVYVIDGVKIVK